MLHATLCAAVLTAAMFAERANMLFGLDGRQSLLAPEDCGLVNGMVAFNGWIENPLEVRGLYSPPYCSSDFSLELRLFRGGELRPVSYTWRPEVLRREGTNALWSVSSSLYPVSGERAGVMEVVARNITDKPQWLDVTTLVAGGVGKVAKWQFGKPGWTPLATLRHDDCIAILENPKEDAAVAVALPGGTRAYLQPAVSPGDARRFHVSFAIGSKTDVVSRVKALRAAPVNAIERSVADWRKRVDGLCARFPALETDNAVLERLYCRSLLHFLLNEWNLPDFRLKPYYATGGVNGGCMGNYLWNFSEVYRMWPLLNPSAAKEHIRTFLKLDLTKCFAYDPAADEGFGPHYPVNQEKILLLAHAYAVETGDRAFLNEMLDGRRIVERLVDEALALDDISKPVALVDYGDGNNHLELRENLRYDGIIPDMNLRRVVCFRLADELCHLAEYRPPVDLVARAASLKKLVRERLWDARLGWFHNVDKGRVETRWTMQMFKALGWGDWALDPDQEAALLGHLMDEREFLGPYGIHSLAKTDPAYDVHDVDNGGPGACVSFAPAIVDRLYRSNRAPEAERIFRRLWWLADAMPYWGDSHYADRRDYRRDTPLVNDIQGGALAQTVIFGLFGIEPKADGSVSVTPHLPAGTGRMALRNVRLGGRVFDVVATTARGVEVCCGSTHLRGANGETLVLAAPNADGAAAGQDVPVPNADFEEGEKGWRVLAPSGRIEKGAGFEGSSGFVFEMKKGEDVKWPHSERFPVEGGYAYRVTLRMRSDDFKGGRCSFSFAVYNAHGKVVGGCSPVRLTDNEPRRDGWYRAEAVTALCPLDAKEGGFYLWAPEGCSGKIQVDDIRIAPVAANPMDRMFSSAERDEASSGTVVFRAAYTLNPLKYPSEGLSAELSCLTLKGPTRRPAALRNGIVAAKVAVSELAFGQRRVALLLKDRDGRILGETSCTFTRTNSEPVRKVHFDRFHRTVVDGKPFFPLGMFFGKVTEEGLRTLGEGPFNCIMPYNEYSQKALDLCAEKGVRVLYHLSGEFKDIDTLPPEKAVPFAESHFTDVVRRLKDHPAILAWYIADEVPSSFAPILTERRRRVHEVDPDHPTWVVLDKPGQVRDLADGFDCIGMDPYPIGNLGDESRTAIGIASGWAMEARAATCGFRPMWHVPQAFNWEYYRRGSAVQPPNLRWPTFEELRTMTWQPIAAGANGLVYYSFFDIHASNRGWSKEIVRQKWQEVCDVAREVKAKEDVLLSEPGPRVTDLPKDLVARTWRTKDGRTHLLVCNTRRESVSGTLSVGGKDVSVELEPMGVKFQDWMD